MHLICFGYYEEHKSRICGNIAGDNRLINKSDISISRGPLYLESNRATWPRCVKDGKAVRVAFFQEIP